MVKKPNKSKLSFFFYLAELIAENEKIAKLAILGCAVVLTLLFSVEKISETIVKAALLFFLIEHILEVLGLLPFNRNKENNALMPELKRKKHNGRRN